ncbi:unnamed protein product, partial [Rotaria magnacalcarata]
MHEALTNLDLYCKGIQSEGAARLSYPLKYNTTITTLNLYANNIGAEGASYLASALSYNT